MARFSAPGPISSELILTDGSAGSEEGDQDGGTVRSRAEQARREAQRAAEAGARSGRPVGGSWRSQSRFGDLVQKELPAMGVSPDQLVSALKVQGRPAGRKRLH